jgi:protein-S-isoprenylcysteine O-methyltransferase Ste14
MFPLVLVSSAMLAILGLGIMVLGIVIAVASEGQFRRAHTTVNTFGVPIRLVTDGWFEYSRNPMYLSFVLMLVGGWIALGTLSPLLGVLAFIVVTDRWYIAHEERRLAEIFGKDNETYRMRTRRWL